MSVKIKLSIQCKKHRRYQAKSQPRRNSKGEVCTTCAAMQLATIGKFYGGDFERLSRVSDQLRVDRA